MDTTLETKVDMNEDEILKDEEEDTLKTSDGAVKIVSTGLEKMQVEDTQPKFPTPPKGSTKPKQRKRSSNAAPSNANRPIERVKRIQVYSDEEGDTRPPPKKKQNVQLSSDVVLVCMSTGFMTTDDFRQFQTALGKQIQSLRGSIKIKIQRVELKNGNAHVYCADKTTMFWIEAKAPTWTNGKYKIQVGEQLTQVSFFIYGENELNRDGFLLTFKEQNDVDIGNWRVLKIFPQISKKNKKLTGHIFVVGMSGETYEKIKDSVYYFLLNEIKPQLWNKKDEQNSLDECKKDPPTYP